MIDSKEEQKTSKQRLDQVGELSSLWLDYRLTNEKLVDGDSNPEAFQLLIDSGVPAHEIKKVITWLPKSDFWDQPGKGQLAGPDGFRRGFPTIREQFEKYLNTRRERRKRND